MSQLIEKKTEILGYPEGGCHKVVTEVWWIVRMVTLGTGTPGPALCCKSPLGRRRTWSVCYEGYEPYKFASKAEAKKAIKCKAVQERLSGEKWRDKQPKDAVEIVKVAHRVETITSTVREVEERPGCNPMVALAIETAQQDARATKAKKAAARLRNIRTLSAS